MPYQGLALSSISRRLAFAAMVFCVLAAFQSAATAQSDLLYTRPPAVGGVAVNADGVLSNAAVDDTGRLARLMRKMLEPVPAELAEATELRMVSLRKLEEAIGSAIAEGKPLSDEMRYLAGLQEIRYVFVDPESRDIILAGPAEGWKVDARGAVVGAETGRPVMLLDDLLVALRTARPAMTEVISCSIDPTPEGLTRLRNFTEGLGQVADRRKAMASFKELLGAQKITVTVVPETSHFARVMIAADYRMKRLGMNLDRSPVKGLSSYLHLLKGAGASTKDMFPRWWLEPRYESVLRSPDGLAWELHGASVKTMSEADFFNAAGHREQTVEANPVAKEWADNFTEKYDELAVADPVFGQLRNCMQMAIVAALIVKEDLAGKAGYSLPTLLDPTDVEIEKLPAPRQVDTVISSLKVNRNNWLVSASGGVSINSYAMIQEVTESPSLVAVHAKATGKQPTTWWWN